MWISATVFEKSDICNHIPTVKLKTESAWLGTFGGFWGPTVYIEVLASQTPTYPRTHANPTWLSSVRVLHPCWRGRGGLTQSLHNSPNARSREDCGYPHTRTRTRDEAPSKVENKRPSTLLFT